MNIHEKYIKRCIELAKNGLGTTYPNPLVGAVIVSDGNIIGEGWHRKAGEPHAEVMAINAVDRQELFKKATLYVNLEPCSHKGRTPPCTELILSKGIKQVVIGSIDSHEKVCGKGVAQLEQHGCNVVKGVLEQECFELNKRFFTFHEKQRPYILLKWAQSTDGYFDRVRTSDTATGPNWITCKASRQRVHQMRAEEHSIIIGTTTAINDNPSLNVRSWKGVNPLRIIIDSELKVPENYAIYDGSSQTLIYTEKSQSTDAVKKVEFSQLDFNTDVIRQIVQDLYKRGIVSVLVEGGASTLQYFIDSGLWDEARVFTGTTYFHEGLPAPMLPMKPDTTEMVSADTLDTYFNADPLGYD